MNSGESRERHGSPRSEAIYQMCKALLIEKLLRERGDMEGVKKQRETLYREGHWWLLDQLMDAYGPLQEASALPQLWVRPALALIH